MRRTVAAVAIAVVCATAGSAGAASRASVLLKIGDAVDVLGTKIACYAITSNKKNGIACVLVSASGKPIAGSYGAGLAVDGTVVLNHLNADGTAKDIFKRKPASSEALYRAHINDTFGLQVSSTVSLGCRVINVTSTQVAALYRGVKVSCWRATASSPVPNTYGISISNKMAGVFSFDAKGNVASGGVVRAQ